MRGFRRIGLVLGLAALSAGTSANAQDGGAAPNAQAGGAAPNAQVGGVAVDAQNGGNLNGGLPDPVEKDAEHKDPRTSKPAPTQGRRSSFFDRVTTVRRDEVPSSSPATRVARPGGASAVSGVKPQADPLRPHHAQAMQARIPAADPHVSAGSSWHQESERPASPTQGAVRSTMNNYYPGMRSGRQPNANAAQVANAGRGRTRAPAGLMLMPGASPAHAARSGQPTTPIRAPSSAGPAGRR